MSNRRREFIEYIDSREPVEADIDISDKADRLTDIYDSDTYGLNAMRETLPSHCYKKIREVMQTGSALDPEIADMVANGMKEWAIKQGATHYCHWFLPLNGLAAEKHDSFISIFPGDDKVLLEFSGMQLIKGEPDASSFPSGGIRSTWEARGYTVWDATSPAFIRREKNGAILCIPTAFCSWTGEALDQKTPLLRSMEYVSNESIITLSSLFNEKHKRISPTLGIEQEFFLIDRKFYLARPDLVNCGRTLIGAKPPKGQEMEDHYFGTMNSRIISCIQEVEWKMWRLGMPLKTRHNEVAPGQYEVAPIFERANIAADHNMMLMDILKNVSTKHGLVCLFHEKPFAGVNGSGKHNNWSLSTDGGSNLLEPGHTPSQNARFILFLTAIIRAVDIHADLLRASVAVPGNEHRLGANEAPPAIISIYLGKELDTVINNIINNTDIQAPGSDDMDLGVVGFPPLPKDSTDRNRTSPFAFTGNKFEFRAVGSSQVVNFPCIVLNTIVAESLRFIREEILREMKVSSRQTAFNKIIKDTLIQHVRVVFNGDGYSGDWKELAKSRGLANLPSTPEALTNINSEKNIKLFSESNILSPVELESRQEILFEIYNKSIKIEANSLYDLVSTLVLPACFAHQKNIAESVNSIMPFIQSQKSFSQPNHQYSHLSEVVESVNLLIEANQKLLALIKQTKDFNSEHSLATFLNQSVIPQMNEVRKFSDHLEGIVEDKSWPVPKYSEILFLR
ncbi:glutamate-ammonia ligase [Dictyostelium discoideum AX4]|uniref:Type-3 glutamine synthetase n=1 Tax=Dictyostelium discoideum TaxID=44689 RepID=GLNA3_DICDI|nr:glutamate-ammonia ligase [Dictyostelium discoideum AX4]Q54WR9.1 RecName: Full=Type-3 glutamine synthetase; AltName: Full=Type-3 glutamate--ammonia ligase; Short=Type-3 GS [Dictyostelium discoideum]EAL67734.1 glutamate-ammonia ligase [Dictyostelium discoideum AX4]|eukprot:XP_641648.1 glutamate-ammonia ligase [Dictyostelium discoideum AX4]